jgi:hypothetical protein
MLDELDLQILSVIRTETLRTDGGWMEISNRFLAARCTHGDIELLRKRLQRLTRVGLLTPVTRDGGGFGIVVEELPFHLRFTPADKAFMRDIAVAIN